MLQLAIECITQVSEGRKPSDALHKMDAFDLLARVREMDGITRADVDELESESDAAYELLNTVRESNRIAKQLKEKLTKLEMQLQILEESDALNDMCQRMLTDIRSDVDDLLDWTREEQIPKCLKPKQ